MKGTQCTRSVSRCFWCIYYFFVFCFSMCKPEPFRRDTYGIVTCSGKAIVAIETKSLQDFWEALGKTISIETKSRMHWRCSE